MNKESIINNRYGKLVVVKETDKVFLPCGQPNRVFICKCDCGNEKTVRLLHLKRFRTLSCGCISKTRNGESHDLLFKVWKGIQYRCSKDYNESHLYFKKGISVCDLWINSYEDFKNWSLTNGYKKGLQIDRRDNSKGYNPENCRWVTSKINNNNRDDTIMVFYDDPNKAQPIRLLLDRLGKQKDFPAIYGRLKRGWNHKKAIDTPIRKFNTYKLKLKQGEK